MVEGLVGTVWVLYDSFRYLSEMFGHITIVKLLGSILGRPFTLVVAADLGEPATPGAFDFLTRHVGDV